jgi:hypothetical protein
MKKRRTLTVVPLNLYAEGGPDYRVIAVTNSLEYNPWEHLSRVDLGKLCEDETWTVIIKAGYR